MSQLFDIKTLLLTTVLTNLVIAGLLIYYWGRQRTYPGFGFWAASHAIGSGTYLLYALRGTIPDFISVVVAGALVALFASLRLEGIRLFVDRTWRQHNLLVYPLLLAPLLFYFSHVVDSILARTVALNLVMAILSLQMLGILVRKARQTGDGIYWAPVVFFGAFAGLLLLRLGIWLLFPAERGLFAASTANNTFFLVILLHDIGIAVSYLMLNSKRRTDELHQAHRELQHLTDTLQQRVQDETDKNLLQERLLAHQARLASMGEMLAVIAHQWRQPLSTLAMIIQRLDQLQLQGRLSAGDMAEARSNSMDQILHLSETIEEFRRYYLPDREKVLFAPHDGFFAAINLIQPHLSASGIDCGSFIAGPQEVRLLGHSNQFKQILFNLIANAHDAILARRSREPDFSGGSIEMTLDTSAGRCRIDVSDNGCGIPPDTGSRIFEAFYTTKEIDGGTGIGLYLTRTIVVDGFHGTIDYTSSSGRTVFTVILPIPQQESADARS